MNKKIKSLTEKVYKKIRDEIITSSLKPGERLIEKKLCEKYNVSRTPLREALMQLQAQGYITMGGKRGSVVKRLSMKEVEELYNILALLEPQSSAKAASRRTKKDISKLNKLFDVMSSNIKKDDYRLLVSDNDKFHNLIINISRSEVLLEIINTIRNRLYRFRILMLRTGSTRHFLPQHKTILDAIVDGDAKKAEETMKNHMLAGKKERMKFLKTYPELL